MNYFNLFQISQKFNINKKKLLNKFYELQKIYHPDIYNKKNINKNEQLIMSIKINQGFNVLKNKFTRAHYLLKLKKKEYLFKKKKEINKQEILLKHFQLYEKIQEIKKKLNALTRIKKFIQKIKKKISLNFKKFNEKIKKKKIYSADKIFFHISFLYKIFKKSKQTKKKLLTREKK